WRSERPLLTSRAVFHFTSPQATWLGGLLSTSAHSCGTALESHQLRCREAPLPYPAAPTVAGSNCAASPRPIDVFSPAGRSCARRAPPSTGSAPDRDLTARGPESSSLSGPRSDDGLDT